MDRAVHVRPRLDHPSPRALAWFFARQPRLLGCRTGCNLASSLSRRTGGRHRARYGTAHQPGASARRKTWSAQERRLQGFGSFRSHPARQATSQHDCTPVSERTRTGEQGSASSGLGAWAYARNAIQEGSFVRPCAASRAADWRRARRQGRHPAAQGQQRSAVPAPLEGCARDRLGNRARPHSAWPRGGVSRSRSTQFQSCQSRADLAAGEHAPQHLSPLSATHPEADPASRCAQPKDQQPRGQDP